MESDIQNIFRLGSNATENPKSFFGLAPFSEILILYILPTQHANVLHLSGLHDINQDLYRENSQVS